jgi:hypothetical protein
MQKGEGSRENIRARGVSLSRIDSADRTEIQRATAAIRHSRRRY